MRTETEPASAGTQQTRPPEELPRGSLLADRYEIDDCLGAGGMARVYRAYDRLSKQVVALKVLDPDRSASPHFQSRLARELRNARAIHHPNVCRVYDFSTGGGRCFLTMELAEGGTLRASLGENAPKRPLADRLADARAIAGAVAAIHAAGIVHRDLKPENILRMRDGRLLVADFGVARDLSSTTTVDPAGTPQYMAPELLRGATPDKRSDVYALGVVLHELLFGERPGWKGGRADRPTAREGSIRSGRERWLFRVCAECLDERPSRRPVDGAAVVRRLDRQRRSSLRFPLVAFGVVLAGAGLTLGLRARQRSGSAPAGDKVLVTSGTALELSRTSRPFLTANGKGPQCISVKSGNVLEIINKDHRGPWLDAYEYDLETGRSRPSRLARQAYALECPKRSPDGKRLLFTRPTSGAGEIMLSDDPDGVSAHAVAVGRTPVWLPSGEGFVYANVDSRVAIYRPDQPTVLFPQGGRPGDEIWRMAFNARGDRLTIVLTELERSTLVTYGFPDRSVIEAVGVKGSVLSLHADRKRDSFVVGIMDGGLIELSELKPTGLFRRASLAGFNLAEGLRTELGMVVSAWRITYSMVITDHRGDHREVFYAPESDPVVSARGDILFPVWLPDGRLVVSLQRWRDTGPIRLTDGPGDEFPSFGAGGNAVFFVRESERAIVRCDLGDGRLLNCQTLFVSPETPSAAVASPDGRWVSYYTGDGATARLHVLDVERRRSRDLGQRDLDPMNFTGWATGTQLWQCNSANQQWELIDIKSGAASPLTGPPNPDKVPDGSHCTGRARSEGQWPTGFSGRTISDVVEELRLVPEL